MKLSDNQSEVFGWVILLFCFLGGIEVINPEIADELTTSIVFLLLSYIVKRGVFYFMFALAVGKLIDGAGAQPYKYMPSELEWDMVCTSGLAVYYMVKRRKIDKTIS